MALQTISATERQHPCFFSESRGRFGRIHLPVAAECNIQCAYCRRDSDCLHENRPGVSSEVISPQAAALRVKTALQRMPQISVAGIAGPGDPFCKPEVTLQTFELLRRNHPDLPLCVSSNGLNLTGSIPALKELGVRFVTVTVNTVDPGIGAMLCRRICLDGNGAEGRPAAAILIDRQLEALVALKAAGIIVKVNAVVIAGVNDDHMLFLAKQMGRLGVDLMNLIPLIPVTGTELAGHRPPKAASLKILRDKASEWVPQMQHCKRCRSDAMGLLY